MVDKVIQAYPLFVKKVDELRFSLMKTRWKTICKIAKNCIWSDLVAFRIRWYWFLNESWRRNNLNQLTYLETPIPSKSEIFHMFPICFHILLLANCQIRSRANSSKDVCKRLQMFKLGESSFSAYLWSLHLFRSFGIYGYHTAVRIKQAMN